jgi:alkylated DNA repair dioxygenase AlkB
VAAMANIRSLTAGTRPGPDRAGAWEPLTWQPSLLGGAPAVRPDATFASVRRVALDHWCWIDLAPGWLAGADDLFESLLACAPWRAREVPMYGRMVAEPRLTAWWEGGVADPALPAGVAEIAAALGERYGAELTAVGAALYRDGRDSVAMHSDRVARELPHPLVAIVSLGGPRRLLVRPKQGGGSSRSFVLGPGDLLVMGGACQERFEHGIPKVAAAPPRISLQLRPQWASADRAIPAR